MGIEPTTSAWKAEVLPLNYTRVNDYGAVEGIEPSNVGTTIRCVNHFATTAMIEWFRTESNCRHMELQSIALPTELLNRNKAVSTGIEPAISCVTGRRVNRYTTRPIKKNYVLREADLNHRPSGYRPDELPNYPR